MTEIDVHRLLTALVVGGLMWVLVILIVVSLIRKFKSLGEEKFMAKSKLQNNLSNQRRTLRKLAENLARSHKGCAKARGCGCFTDQAISVYELAERKIFEIELASYASEGKDGGGYDHYDKNKFQNTLDSASAPSPLAVILREGEEYETKA